MSTLYPARKSRKPSGCRGDRRDAAASGPPSRTAVPRQRFPCDRGGAGQQDREGRTVDPGCRQASAAALGRRRRNIAQCLLTPTKSCIPPRVDRHTPPGAPVCGLRWGLGAPTSHGRPCASSTCARPSVGLFPTPLPRTNAASRRPGFARRFRPMIRFGRGGDSVRADRLSHPVKATKEVTMSKRLTIVALAVAASRAGGPRHGLQRLSRDYTTTDGCQLPQPDRRHRPRASKVFDEWAETEARRWPGPTIRR